MALFEETKPNWKLELGPPPGFTIEKDQAPVVGVKFEEPPVMVREPMPEIFRKVLFCIAMVELIKLNE